ncbi:phage tail family protein [Oceanobacillus damuensis]|uniref:phage tail domain-containing protein n=1 Tax=Oceanobacillus damuensis TaxID=937928 RepID=UPI00082EEE54|nr:phage tail domain-containing protein [Oceanobacillus damuensis]
MLGIKFLGKHSYNDFGVTMAKGKEIGIPEKKKIKVAVPFSNIEYDFSEIYGSQSYEPRSLSYPFNIYKPLPGKSQMNSKKTQIINWLMNSRGKQRLYDDAYPGYYFLAEVEGSNSFSEDYDTGILTVEFTAYPFMISELPEGHDIWDEYNFDLDIMQSTSFEVDGELTVILYNVGTPDVIPTITASSAMTIVKDGIIFNVPTGESKSEEFVLNSGENELIITGSGSIAFEFYKELI